MISNGPHLQIGEVLAGEPRQRILNAATQVFTQKGLRGARTREIARLAGVNVASIHYYFGTKEGLYERIIRPIFTMVVDGLKGASRSSADPCRCIEAVVDAYFDLLREHPELPRLMMWELVDGGVALEKVIKPMLKEEEILVSERLRQVFQKGQKMGMFKPHNPSQAVISLVALCVFPFFAGRLINTFFPGQALDAEFMAERRSHVKDLLISGLALHGETSS